MNSTKQGRKGTREKRNIRRLKRNQSSDQRIGIHAITC